MVTNQNTPLSHVWKRAPHVIDRRFRCRIHCTPGRPASHRRAHAGPIGSCGENGVSTRWTTGGEERGRAWWRVNSLQLQWTLDSKEYCCSRRPLQILATINISSPSVRSTDQSNRIDLAHFLSMINKLISWGEGGGGWVAAKSKILFDDLINCHSDLTGAHPISDHLCRLLSVAAELFILFPALEFSWAVVVVGTVFTIVH